MVSWSISGEMIDSCQCPVVCNNLLLREPLQPASGQALQLPPVSPLSDAAERSTDRTPVVREHAAGACTSVTVWTLVEGRFGDLPLGGLNVAALVQSPGPLFGSGGWKRALYVDAAANAEQRAALEEIFNGSQGGYFRRWAQLTAQYLGTSYALIHAQQSRQRRRVTIPGVMDLMTEPVLGGRDRQPFQLVNPPFWKAPGENPLVGRSVNFTFSDHDLNWQLSGRSSCLSPFRYER